MYNVFYYILHNLQYAMHTSPDGRGEEDDSEGEASDADGTQARDISDQQKLLWRIPDNFSSWKKHLLLIKL